MICFFRRCVLWDIKGVSWPCLATLSVSQPLRMRVILLAALLASGQCYGPPKQPTSSSSSQSLPTGLTEFCGTNCVPQQQQQQQPSIQHQQSGIQHQQQPIGSQQQQQPFVQQPQPVVAQQNVDSPNYANNPFLNGAVDLKKPPPPASVGVASQQKPSYPQQQGSYPQQQQQGSYPQQQQQGSFPQQQQQGSYPQQQQQGSFPQQQQQGSSYPQQKPQGTYQQASNQPAPTNKPNYSNNPFLSGQVGGSNPNPAPRACAINTLCVARAMCSSGVLRQEDVLQAKSQNQPCDQSRGETCCRVPDFVQQGAGASPSLIVQQTAGNNQPRPTQRPYTGPLNTTPHPGCAAALKCVSLEYCTSKGVISEVPVILSRDDSENRVPVSECSNPETGAYGFCCRDPNYKDPWPETQEVCNQGTSCEAMWNCPQDRMALPKKGCRVNNDGSTGICCLPAKGGFQQQPQQQFPQSQFPQSQQQSQISSNVIDSRPSYNGPAQQPARPANVPRPPPPQPFVPPRPVVTVPAQAVQPSYPAPQQVNVIPQVVKPAPQPNFPAQQTYPRPNAPQPSYPVNPPPQTIGVDNRPSPTQFFQQQSPSSVNQFPIQAVKVPANNFPAPQPPKVTQAPPRYEAPSLPVPTGGCGIRSVSPGSPQDGESAPGEFPWQALISSSDGSRLCAGAVISESAVLISATCISGRDPSQLKVEVGSWSPYSTSAESQVIPVMVSVKHPKFDSATQANDLAVLVLQQSMRFGRFVGAVCLPEASELTSEGLLQSPGGSCLISSWPKPADSTSKLNRVAVRPVDSQSCEESLRNTYLGKYFQLNRSFMCAAPLDPQRDMCPVSLGGALVCPRSDGHYIMLGASSWDVGCSQPQPSVMCALDVEWVNQVLQTPAQDLQEQQQREQQQFAVAPVVAEQKPGFSQGYGR